MRAIIFSDLHLSSKSLMDRFYFNKLKRILNLNPNEYDIVIISGDLVESNIMNYDYGVNPFERLFELFEKDVVFCLGNHEFAFQSHPEVLKWWSKWSHPNVHCLDVEGFYEKDGYRFIGNVLWYDWSLNNCRQLMQGEIIDGWLDATIKDFDAMKENEKCVKQIFNSCASDKCIKHVLITHMVPHIELNTFSQEQPESPYNAYSGMKRFLLDIQDKGVNLTHAICGHTHRREMKTIWGIDCINIGNDYYFRTGKYSYWYLDLN